MEPLFKTVPWFDASEWENVYELLFSPKSDVNSKRRALQILLVWKSRFPVLPSSIESTLGLLEVELTSPLQEKEHTLQSDRVARLMYSAVIMRFINHALDDAPFKGQTLLQAASTMNIPEWIVNLRHETAHGHELPSLNLLKNAALYAMNWLFDTYWVPQNEIIENFTIRQYASDDFEQDLCLLINNFNLLAIFSSKRFNVVRFSDIPDEEIKQSLFEFVSERVVKSKVGTHWEMKLKNVLHKMLKEINQTLIQSTSQNKDVFVAKILVDKESLLMVSEIDFFQTTDVVRDKRDNLPDWFIFAFEPLLALIHKRCMISTLMKELFIVANDDMETSVRRTRAGQWIKEISIGLYKSKLFATLSDKYIVEKKCKKSVEKENQLRLLTHHYPNQKLGLTLDLLSPIPDILCNEKFIYENLCKCNHYIKLYVKDFLELGSTVDSKCVEQILNLVDIVSQDNKKSSSEVMNNSNVIRTVEDLINGIENNVEMVTEDNGVLYDKTVAKNDSANELFASSKWERASSDFNWKNCPFGILPWQMDKIQNPSFPSSVVGTL